MFYELSQLAISNLLRARARLAMTAGGVLVGTAAVILLIALTIGLQQVAEAGIGSDATLTEIDVYQNWEFQGDPENAPKLDIATVNSFWKIPGVQAVIPTIGLQTGYLVVDKYYGGAWTQGVDPQLFPYMGITLQSGRFPSASGEVLIGSAVGENFYDPNATEWTPISLDLLTQAPTLVLERYDPDGVVTRRVNLIVVGVIQAGGSYDYSVYIPIQDVLGYNEWYTGAPIDPKTFVYENVKVRAKDREVTNAVTSAIKEMGFSTGGMGEFLNGLNSFFGTMRLMLGGVGGVALLVAAFGVANTMTMAILERTKEIGLMKAIGARDRDVMTIFLIEAGLVGFVGGLSGVGTALFLQQVINQAVATATAAGDGSQGGGMMFLPLDVSQIGGNLMVIPGELIAFALILATTVGVVAGLYPALRASRMPPVIALKSE
ncbi:MAG: FtsX-like permease family protein [Phototrophicales bacterium]|nr:FtsX-like permease family protein [Phototrophicales bacterium]